MDVAKKGDHAMIRYPTDESSARAWVEQVETDATLSHATCADGTLPVRCWPAIDRDVSLPPVLLIHGGAGSWTHWIRNIGHLRQTRDVIVPDLPGLGDAATLPKGYTPADAAAPLIAAVQTLPVFVQGASAGGLHVVGFSWGATIASLVSVALGSSVRSLCLVGPGALGNVPLGEGMKPILGRTPDMTEAEIRAQNRENLYRLMFADPASADELAVYLQGINTARSRFNSPKFARTEIVKQSLTRISCPVTVIYGDRDAPAWRNLDVRRQVVTAACPGAAFESMPGGHWLQYESAELFNPWLSEWLERHDSRR